MRLDRFGKDAFVLAMVAYFLQVLRDEVIAGTTCSGPKMDLLLSLHGRQEPRFVVEHWIHQHRDYPRAA